MTSSKIKTVIAVSAGILFIVLFLGGITVFILKLKARAAHERELAKLAEENPIEYKILHQPSQNADALRKNLVGTWELVANKGRGETGLNYLRPNNGHLKIFTESNWAIVTYDFYSNVVYSASGGYTLQGDVYTESIEKATGMMTRYLGAHPRFRIRVEGDKYYEMGAGKNPSLEEMWQRVQE